MNCPNNHNIVPTAIMQMCERRGGAAAAACKVRTAVIDFRAPITPS